MHTTNMRRSLVLAVAVSAGLTSCPVFAYDGDNSANNQLQSVAVEPVRLDDPATTGPVDGPVVEAPVAVDPPIVSADETANDSPAPCSCCNSNCCTKKKKEAATAAMKGAYKGLFYDNNFRYLSDPCYDGPAFLGDNLKGLCDGKLDIGGEARVRYHSEDNMRGLGVTGRDDNFWLTRYRMFADYRMNDIFRLYGEYLYADSGGEFFNNRPIEENRGEIQNLFFDTKLTERLTMRLGRQELLYGAQRLATPLDWANTRLTFEGAKFIYNSDDWNVQGFFTHPVNRIAANESKIDDANENVDFYGVYATRSDLSIGTLDAYYLGHNNSVEDFDYHTIGSRVFGSTDDGLLYEFEGGVQFGENSPGYGDHNAGFFTGGLGRQLSVCTNSGEWKPTVWFWYDWASGGDDVPAARGDNSFDQLFPLAHKYLGFIDLFGRRNINDVNAQFITPVLGSKVKLLVWYHYLFLDQKTTPYNVNGVPYNPANAAGDRELGHEIDVLFNITLNPRNSALVGYSYFNAGDYYNTTAGIPNAAPPRADADAQFFYFQYQTRF